MTSLPPPRVLVAPNAFKGTLTARQAAEAIADGLRAGMSGRVEIDLLPVADGGDGTLDVLLGAGCGFEERQTAAPGPLGRSVQARWGWREADQTALVEMAEASGLRLLPEAERDPWRASTRGTGALIAAAMAAGADRVVVGVGGSATVDGGAGALDGLAWRFLGANGEALAVPAELDRLARIEEPPKRLAPASWPAIDVLCDVDNPLRGPRGAAAVFGPQKGASAEDVPRLEARLAKIERALERFAEEKERYLWVVGDTPGAGAAGGLAFGLAAALGASLVPGADRTLELIAFEERLADANVVVTGEGKLDAQTASGKAPMAVAKAARLACAPCVALCGAVEEGAPRDLFAWTAAAPGADSADAAKALAEAARHMAPRLEALARESRARHL